MEISTPLIGSAATGFGATTPVPDQMRFSNNDEGLKKASKEFVSILFSYMFQSMRGENNEEDSFFGGENTDMFISFLDQEIGNKFASQGGTDLVNSLYHQLKGDNIYKGNGTNNLANVEKAPVTEEELK